MGRTPRIPLALKQRPFSLYEARKAGLTLSSLTSQAWQRIGPELYRWNELSEDPWLTHTALRNMLPPEAIFAGATAAWLHGLDLEPTNPVEVAVPPSSGLRSRAGLIVRRCSIPSSEVVSIRGLRAAALPLTLAGLCLHRRDVEALVAIDMAGRPPLDDPAALGKNAHGADSRPSAPPVRVPSRLAPPARRTVVKR